MTAEINVFSVLGSVFTSSVMYRVVPFRFLHQHQLTCLVRSTKVLTTCSQGRSQNFTLGQQKPSAEGARIEAPRGVQIEEGVSPSRVWESVVRPPAGPGAKPGPPTHFWHI